MPCRGSITPAGNLPARRNAPATGTLPHPAASLFDDDDREAAMGAGGERFQCQPQMLRTRSWGCRPRCDRRSSAGDGRRQGGGEAGTFRAPSAGSCHPKTRVMTPACLSWRLVMLRERTRRNFATQASHFDRPPCPRWATTAQPRERLQQLGSVAIADLRTVGLCEMAGLRHIRATGKMVCLVMYPALARDSRCATVTATSVQVLRRGDG